MQVTSPFYSLLVGNPFYKLPNYIQSTKRDLAQKEALPPIYTYNTETKVMRIAKQIFSILIFPILIYKALHLIVAVTIFLSCRKRAANNREKIFLNSDWKYKRFTVEVNGSKIDGMIVGKEETFNNGRWILFSNENNEFYEEKFHRSFFYTILEELKGNAVIYNYPGVAASSGLPFRQSMIKSYQAMLNLLEDKEKGIGAKEIIAYGRSIGGVVQGDALKDYELKKDINYVFVKHCTLSDVATIAYYLMGSIISYLVRILGWNMSSIQSSIKLTAPEIILQTANVQTNEELTDPSKIIHDGVLPAEATLAKALLENKNCPRNNKFFFAIEEDHHQDLLFPEELCDKIKSFLPSSDSAKQDNFGVSNKNLQETLVF